VAAALLSALLASCITQDLHFEIPSQFFATGVCTCAVCWDRPFCWSRVRPDEFPTPVDGVCPADFELALPASRYVETTCVDHGGLVCDVEIVRQQFFCEAPDGVALDLVALTGDDYACPLPGTDARARLAAVDPCQDVILDCRDPADPEFASCAELPADTSACPVGYQRGREVSGCANDVMGMEGTAAPAAREKVVAACSHLGMRAAPSGDRPARYCYTACLDPLQDFDPEISSCEDSIFDPPEVTAGAYDWLLEDTGSTVTIAVGTDLARFPVEGRVALHAPRCLPGDTCPAELSSVRAVVPSSFTLAGESFENVIFQNPTPIRGGSILPVGPSESRIELPTGAQLFGSATTSLSELRLGAQLTSASPITGTIRWDLRLVTIDAVFADPMTETVVTLHIVGRIPNRAPLAAAGPDLTIECTSPAGADVPLSGTGTYDPDDPQGGQLPLYFNWSSHPANDRAPVTARGREATVRQRVGRTSYDLTVSDPMASSTTDSVDITVVDTAGPLFDGGNLPLCIPNDNRMRLFSADTYAMAFQDACDTSLNFRVVGVTSSQVDRRVRTPDIKVGTAGSFCTRGEREPLTPGSRTYFVAIEATDDQGNVTTGGFPVVVALGACPGGTWAVPAVADSDPRCGSVPTSDAGVAVDAGTSPPAGCQGCSAQRPSRAIALPFLALAVLATVRRRRSRRRDADA
jgi:hypothetical protein